MMNRLELPSMSIALRREDERTCKDRRELSLEFVDVDRATLLLCLFDQWWKVVCIFGTDGREEEKKKKEDVEAEWRARFTSETKDIISSVAIHTRPHVMIVFWQN